MNYVTIESVTTQLGPNWQGDGDANLAVTQANAWLRAKPLRQIEVIPEDVLLAGAYAAQLAAKGELQAFEHEGFWQPMDTLRDKTHLEQLWSSGKAPWKSWE